MHGNQKNNKEAVMRKFIMLVILAWVVGLTGACQYDGDLFITYLVDGGSDGGVDDSGVSDADSDTDSDSDTDTDNPDGGEVDAGECVCVAGDCCDGCHYYQLEDEIVCEETWLKRCVGLCGLATVQQMDAQRICNGTGDTCEGGGVWTGTWEDHETCGSNEACVAVSLTWADCWDCDTAGCDPGGEECADWT